MSVTVTYMGRPITQTIHFGELLSESQMAQYRAAGRIVRRRFRTVRRYMP